MEDKDIEIQGAIAKERVKIISFSIIAALLLVAELYIIVNYPRGFLMMTVGAIVLIADLYFVINSVINFTVKTKALARRDYEELYKAQKASYLIIRKNFEEMSGRLAAIEEASSLPADEIINAQKAVAKVTISRSKENTDALMNSNDELINHLFSFEEKIDSNNQVLVSKQQEMLDATRGDLQNQFQSLSLKMQELETKMAAAPAYQQPVYAPPVYAQPMYQQPMYQQPMPAPMPAPQPMPMPAAPAMEAPVMEAPVPEMPAMDIMPEIPMDSMVEEPIVEEAVMEEPLFEEAPLDLGLDLEPEIIDETPSIEEPVDMGVDLGLDLEPEVAAEPEPIPEPEPEPAPAPAFEPSDDPNKMMSPDDIAALLASMNNDAPAEPEPEPIPEPEPEPAPAPAFEPSDDPNKMMSPDDIAALLASMNNDAPAEPEPEPEPEPEQFTPVEVPDVGVDLSDPNRVMSPEEIQKLFASL